MGIDDVITHQEERSANNLLNFVSILIYNLLFGNLTAQVQR